jgi:uncharacterized protein
VLLLAWIFRILLVLLMVRFVLRLFRARPAIPRSGRSARPQERIGGTLVRDPQCGTYVPRENALSIGRGDSTRYFCSAACRDAWAAAHRT